MHLTNKRNEIQKIKRLRIVFLISLGVLFILGIILTGKKLLLNNTIQEAALLNPPVKPSGWVEETGKWYYYDEESGEKKSGWSTIDGERYYFDPVSQERVSGITELSAQKWYYFDENGQLQKNCIIDNYIINGYGIITDRLLTEEENLARLEELQSGIDSFSSQYGAEGVSIALIENGKVTDTFVYGNAQKASTATTKIVTPMTPDTKIRIASISKVISSMVGLKMMENGMVDLDASIGDYWGFPVCNPAYPEHTISLRSIYTHSSSIADLDSYKGIEDKLRRNVVFRNTEPLHPSSCSYCNFAFAVSGATLEKAGGKIIDDLADETFFNDLGIDAAFASGRIEDKTLLAELYYTDSSVSRSLNSLSNYTGSNTPGENGNMVVGGLCISAADLAKLICILANDGVYEDKRYLESETIELMETPFCQTDYHGVEVTQCMPLKYNTDIYGEDSLYFHTGSAYGVYSLFTYNPETKNGVVVITTGALGTLDEYGVYAVCGDISELLYSSLKKDWKLEPLFLEPDSSEDNTEETGTTENILITEDISPNNSTQKQSCEQDMTEDEVSITENHN